MCEATQPTKKALSTAYHDLADGKYVHPLRINMGFVARADATTLITCVEAVVAQAMGDGSLQRPAQESGAACVAPTQTNFRAAIGIADLAGQ